MTLDYLLSRTNFVGRMRLEQWLDALESNPYQIIPAAEFGPAWEEANATLVPELRNLRRIEVLERMLRFEEERLEHLCSTLGIGDMTEDLFNRLSAFQRRVRTGALYLTTPELVKLVDIGKLIPRPVLSNTLVSFERFSGMQTHTPERLFYRDMCWHYNGCLDDTENVVRVWQTLRETERQSFGSRRITFLSVRGLFEPFEPWWSRR